MAHHHHHHVASVQSERRLWVAIALNLLITLAEVVGGILSGSLALLSDALHNLNDAASLGISLFALRVGRRAPDEKRTFGYRRAEIIGALFNLFTLLFIALFLIKEAIERYLHPRPIAGELMLGVALVGLGANLLTALLLYRDAQASLNIRSAFAHIVADAVSSVAVVGGGVLVWLYQSYWVDTLLSVLISAYILVMSVRMLREVVHILLKGVPSGLTVGEVVATMEGVPGVRDVRHVHIWQLDESHIALEAHVVPEDGDPVAMEQLKCALKQRLEEQFGINHSTLEFELQACVPPEARCYIRQAEEIE